MYIALVLMDVINKDYLFIINNFIFDPYTQGPPTPEHIHTQFVFIFQKQIMNPGFGNFFIRNGCFSGMLGWAFHDFLLIWMFFRYVFLLKLFFPVVFARVPFLRQCSKRLLLNYERKSAKLFRLFCQIIS